jgi:DNA-binding PadR family transcriptional regulator
MVDPQKFLPLTQTSFYIVISLRAGPKHGYAIGKDVEKISDGSVRVAIGNLYTALKRLLDAGLIEPAGKASRDSRKTYRLTALGERVADLETERINRLARVAKRAAAPAASPATTLGIGIA